MVLVSLPFCVVSCIAPKDHDADAEDHDANAPILPLDSAAVIDMEVEDQGPEIRDIKPQPLSAQVAELLERKRHKCLSSIAHLYEFLSSSSQQIVRCLHAVAESVARQQEARFQNVMTYVKVSQPSGMRGLLVVEHTKHDETQTLVIAQYPGCEKHSHTGKVHVIQNEWTAVLDSPKNGGVLVLHGSQSQVLRVTENATGKTIHKLLEHAGSLSSLTSSTPFERHVHVYETDEGSANLRAQQVWECEHPDSVALTAICCACLSWGCCGTFLSKLYR